MQKTVTMKLSDRQIECIKSEFKKLKLLEYCYGYYYELLSEWIQDADKEDGIDITGDPNAVSDDKFTASYMLDVAITDCRDRLLKYYNLIKMGYSKCFADKYFEKIRTADLDSEHSCDYAFYDTVSEFGNGQINLDNPAYASYIQ
jgi:hypothetical protein